MADAPIAETGHGRLRGISAASDVWAYLGIPYAAPPTGRLRWRLPEPPRPWSGIRDAAAFGADPVQPPGLRASRAPGMAEDCLYLNVWAPKERREGGWPVLVWSCGGAFTTGSGAFAEDDPARLAARGAVVVSFNIRLNIFGFLAHPALSAESPHGASGNYGILDQAAALAWVRENIAQFGGDAGRITFFGQSAGAAVGALLLASPLVDKPYDRAILQSPGSFSALLPLEAAERHGAALGASAEEIRAIPADQLLDRLRQLPAVRPSLWLARPIRPIADGWVITTESPFAPGNFKAVSAIIGTNEDEGRFFAARMGVNSVADYRAFVSRIFGGNTDAALAHYPVADEAQVPEMFAQVCSDRAINHPVAELVDAFSRSGAAVHRYVYAYRGDADRPPTHADEAAVLFDTLPHRRPADAEMAGIMARYWLAFAESGEPNGAGLAEWPAHEPDEEPFLRLDVPPSRGSHWRSDHIRFVATHKAD